MPVRSRTLVVSGVVHGTPDSWQATWTGSRAALTRASTAMSATSTPADRQASSTSTARPARASAGAVTATTGPRPASSPRPAGSGSVRCSGLRIVLATRSRLYARRWRAASTTVGGHR